jgi:hypothetical protein
MNVQKLSRTVILEEQLQAKKETIIFKTLKEKDVCYLEADKSSSIIAVDVPDYHERMDIIITVGPYEDIMLNLLNQKQQ